MTSQCPCESGLERSVCCKQFHDGARPETAEQLMRSRYTAYVLCNEAYLLRTWHERTRPASITFDPAQKWLGLKIKATAEGGSGDDTGIVEFVARYKIAGKGHRLHEVSRFERANGCWVYLDGDVTSR